MYETEKPQDWTFPYFFAEQIGWIRFNCACLVKVI